jgi:acyl-CoA thioesterase FadM
MPLRFRRHCDDVTISRLGTKSITFRYAIHRAEGHVPCAVGTVTCAVVDLAKFVAVPVPERVRDLLRDLVVP